MASGSGSDFIIQSENDSKPRLRGVRIYLDFSSGRVHISLRYDRKILKLY